MEIAIGKNKTDMAAMAAARCAAAITAAIADRGEARVLFASAASQF